MLNSRSNYLTILIATCNRLGLLKRTLESIATGTNSPHEVIVIDGGSTDGTLEFLQAQPGVTPVFQGRMLGTARAYNEVWRRVDSLYTCWLSDDTEVLPGSLDLAVSILESHFDVGMVGLKMRDTLGPYRPREYMGAISEFGILNCNHGVLKTSVLKAVGYFNEGYHSYTIDPDLTASVLCTGRSVVMTKRVSLLHHRMWAEGLDRGQVQQRMEANDNARIYRDKFLFLGPSKDTNAIQKLWRRAVYRTASIILPNGRTIGGVSRLDFINFMVGRYIRLTDPWIHRRHPYHLLQRLPLRVLKSAKNPYRHLTARTGTSDSWDLGTLTW